MKKTIAFLLVLTLILCGCSEKDPSVSESTPMQPPAPVSVAESVTEDSSAMEDEIPTDPKDLAKMVWAMAEENSNGYTATDYELFIDSELDLDGTYTSTTSRMRIKEITGESSPVVYYSVKADDVSSEIWYADDLYYQSSTYGNYKVPMSQDQVAEEVETTETGDTILTLSLDNFGTYNGAKMGDTYYVTFSDPTFDTWMLFADMFTAGMDSTSDCQAFDMEGSLQCDLEGNVEVLMAKMSITMNQDGILWSMVIDMIQETKAVNDSVTIDIPSEDASFVFMDDPMIPALLFTGIPMTTSVPALDYLNTVTFTFSDNFSKEYVTQWDRLTYQFTEQGLEADWGTAVNYSFEDVFESTSETTYWCTDEYRFGTGTLTDPEGSETYSCTDEDFMVSSCELILSRMDTYEYGSNFRLTEDGDRMKLVYNLSEDYAYDIVHQNMQFYIATYNLEDVDYVSSSGIMTFWFDATGTMVEQNLHCLVEAQFGNDLFTISLEDSGVVMAMGDGVELGNTAQ